MIVFDPMMCKSPDQSINQSIQKMLTQRRGQQRKNNNST